MARDVKQDSVDSTLFNVVRHRSLVCLLIVLTGENWHYFATTFWWCNCGSLFAGDVLCADYISHTFIHSCALCLWSILRLMTENHTCPSFTSHWMTLLCCCSGICRGNCTCFVYLLFSSFLLFAHRVTLKRFKKFATCSPPSLNFQSGQPSLLLSYFYPIIWRFNWVLRRAFDSLR